MEPDTYLLKLEQNLMLGAGRWVAEFSEGFRNFPTGGHTFDLYVRGGTRTRGLFLSRLFAYFSLPSYNVGLYAKCIRDDGPSLDELRKEVENRAAQLNIRWNWLVLIRSGGFPAEVVSKVDAFDKPGVGISLVDLKEQDVDTSSNLLGRKALSLIRVFK